MQTINTLVNQQAATLVYLQDSRIMLCFTLAALPLIFLFKVQAQKRSAMPCADMFSQR
ncbi:hypothetical protein [Flavobacterium sp. W21_SRS_FM6]|uniref:hypothetical protein n=1 Tax=Flavobacterium sp. W21_SRS_FM6 TaxID=3240268 RepID=UPI003F923AF6